MPALETTFRYIIPAFIQIADKELEVTIVVRLVLDKVYIHGKNTIKIVHTNKSGNSPVKRKILVGM